MKKIYKNYFLIICKIYSVSISFLDEIFLRKKFKLKHSLNTEGYFKVDKENNLNISNKTFNFILSDS